MEQEQPKLASITIHENTETGTFEVSDSLNLFDPIEVDGEQEALDEADAMLTDPVFDGYSVTIVRS
jgi:hypothetical protein